MAFKLIFLFSCMFIACNTNKAKNEIKMIHFTSIELEFKETNIFKSNNTTQILSFMMALLNECEIADDLQFKGFYFLKLKSDTDQIRLNFLKRYLMMDGKAYLCKKDVLELLKMNFAEYKSNNM